MKIIESIPKISFANTNNFLLIAGPCVVENEDITREIASHIAELSHKHSIPFVFKASYRKANRSRNDSFTGIGDEKALEILAKIGVDFSVPLITDIHTAEEANTAAQYVDILQIPAFLCRQTDLLIAAGNTGKHVSIKKGQFLAPESMSFAAQKIVDTGNPNVLLTERGTTFGYQDLVVDFRGIPVMRDFGYPVIVDLTHSIQQPNQNSGVTGGKPELIETIGRAAIATGADGIFIETHPNPSQALSDGANMLPLKQLEELIVKLSKLKQAVNTL